MNGLAIVGGITAVLVFDTLGSLASRHFEFNYAGLAPGSYLIWMGFGALFAASVPTHAIAAGAIAGGIIGLVDSTAGWWISWRIGPGRIPATAPEKVAIPRLARISATVSARAALVGALGGVLVKLISATT